MNFQFRLTNGTWSQLQTHLHRGDGAEHAAFILAGKQVSKGSITMLDQGLELVSDKDLVGGPRRDSIEVQPGRLLEIVNRAIRAGCSLIEVHNHPFGPAGFSAADEAGFLTTVPYMLESLVSRTYGAIVLTESDLCGRVWNDKAELSLQCVEILDRRGWRLRPTRAVAFHSGVDPTNDLARFDRQVRMFGVEGQAMLSCAHVGVVGLGGLGSLVVEILGRMGLGRFTLIDHDVIETTNLNRVAEAVDADAVSATSKVGVATRSILKGNPAAKVRAMRATVFHPDAIRALSEVDLIIGCTDDVGSRFALNDISLGAITESRG